MKTDIVFENLVVGQKLYSLHWGEVKLNVLRSNESEYYPIRCEVTNVNGDVYEESFSIDGRYSITHTNPDLFLTNPFEKNQERVIEVKDGIYWVKRVLIKVVDGKAVCWEGAETIEEAKNAIATFGHHVWRELQPEQPTAQPKEITLDGVEYLLTPKVK